MSSAPTSAWNWCLGVKILLVARDLVVHPEGPWLPAMPLSDFPEYLSAPPPPQCQPPAQRASEWFSFCLGFWLSFQTWGEGEASSPEGRKPLVVSWFRLMLIESLQLELFHLWSDQSHMSSPEAVVGGDSSYVYRVKWRSEPIFFSQMSLGSVTSLSW